MLPRLPRNAPGGWAVSRVPPMQAFLAHVARYVTLPPAEEAALLAAARPTTYAKGDFLSRAGEVSRDYAWIAEGAVRTYYPAEDGTDHVVAFGIANYWIGDLGSLISGRPADFSVQFLAETAVVRLSTADVHRLYDEAPMVERFFRLITQNAYVAAQRRIVRNFSLPARDRYLLFLEEHPEVVRRVPLYMIASYLGITKEFLSAIRRELAREG